MRLGVLCPGPGASDGPAAHRDVARPAEADQLRGVHRRAVHARAPPGPSLHAADGGLQPPHTVSAIAKPSKVHRRAIQRRSGCQLASLVPNHDKAKSSGTRTNFQEHIFKHDVHVGRISNILFT